MIDAVSYLTLGKVFVANLTGNDLFLGMSVAGVAGFGIRRSLIALVGFLVGGFASWLA
jgi:uncharacterized membrane protein YoaK (UPF0700 family)